MKKIASERFGLTMIAATLVAIIISSTQLYLHNYKIRDEAIKMAGRHNIRLLSKLSLTQLMPEQGHDAILELLNNSHNSPDFAYAAIVDTKNQPLATSSTGKTTIPDITVKDQSHWVSEDSIEQDGHKLLEFRAPVFAQGILTGFIRIGYFQPEMNIELQKLPFFGQLILPVFLLVPLAYWLIKKELRPLRQVNDDMNDILKKQNIGTEYNLNTDFQDFMENFKLFMGKIDQRFDQLNHQSTKAQATTLALSYQRRRIESALQSLPDAILVMDEAGIATFANSKLLPLLGASLEKVLGQPPQIWCESVEIIDLLAKYHSTNHRLQRSDTVEFKPINNPEKTIAVSAYPLFAPKEIETICGTLVVFHDKTQELMADHARHEFINHVAHELKSPLNVIHLYAESLSDQENPDHSQRIQAVNVINDEVERLSNLVSNLLNISKIEAGNITLSRQLIKLGEFLQDIYNSVSLSTNDKQVSFDLKLTNNLTNIKADKELLRIAVNNLLTNAIKYNKLSGTVTLVAEENAQSVLIQITDTGCGIKELDQVRIFDKFYRSDDDNVLQKNGHGLGLALAKEIIELHHGKISLTSIYGQGSTFTIELPKTSTLI